MRHLTANVTWVRPGEHWHISIPGIGVEVDSATYLSIEGDLRAAVREATGLADVEYKVTMTSRDSVGMVEVDPNDTSEQAGYPARIARHVRDLGPDREVIKAYLREALSTLARASTEGWRDDAERVESELDVIYVRHRTNL